MHHQPSNLDPHFEAQTGRTVPFQSLSEEEVMAQMNKPVGLREYAESLGILALVIAFFCLAVVCLTATVHLLVLLVQVGWNLTP